MSADGSRSSYHKTEVIPVFIGQFKSQQIFTQKGRQQMPSDFLMHYGIPGMKWGVRRFQEKGSSKRTPAGKKRYAHSIKDLADKVYNRAVSLESKVTKDVTASFKQNGAKSYGLQNRLKTKSSITRKISDDSKKYNSTSKAANSIKDALRYTAMSSDEDFVSNYNGIKKSLEDLGYTETRCRNYFDLYRQGKAKHKQITTVYSDAKGNEFEIQFQTPSSIKAKEKKTKIYEEARNPKVSASRKSELEKKMVSLAKTVKSPKGVYSIKSHG